MTGFTSPKLDDRNFEDLFGELVRRIPVHSSEWTDHNTSDPGITLLELFAWMGENLLYRMNRVPEKARTEFLRLLNIQLRGASAAEATVVFSLPKGRLTPVLIEAGSTVPRTLVAAGGVEFQIEDELWVLPIETPCYIKRIVEDLEPEDEKLDGVEDVKMLLGVHLGQSEAETAMYETAQLPAVEGGALPAPTALRDAIDRSLWMGVLGPKSDFAGLGEVEAAALRDDLRRELANRTITIGVRVDDELCGPTDHHLCPDPGSDANPYPLVWQIATGLFTGPEPRVDSLRYERLDVVDDRTAALTRSGTVRLRLPNEGQFGNWTADSFPDDYGEDLLGVGDMPPLLEDDELHQRVLTWVRCFRPDPPPAPALPGSEAEGVEPAVNRPPDPVLRWVDSNALSAIQRVTARAESLGFGNGRAAQTAQVSKPSVLPDSLQIEVRESGRWVRWHRVDQLVLSRANDPHYELDAATGTIAFGDGVNGRMPNPGEAIRAVTYQYGGGVAGNVPADAIAKVKRVRTSPTENRLGVTNPLAARFGRDAETEQEAKRRVPKALRHRERAVAAEDFRDLALGTPGVHVGRAEVLPRHKPHERVDEVPGVVTLIVLPASDPLHPDEPQPDQEMLRRVCEHLEPRRLVTTELWVTPPEYVDVWISIAVAVESGFGVDTVNAYVETAVRQQLAPLKPYGPSGEGWPFGRDVTSAEIEAAVLRVEGVQLVHEVVVEGEAGASGGAVPTEKWQLPVVRGVQVTNEPNAEAIDRSGDSARPGGTGIPVPLEREEC